jgi:hypothetical protein
MLLAAAVGMYHTAAAQNKMYYINNLTGKDINTGSKEHPWKSIEKLKMVTLKPGDKVCLRGGQVFQGSIKLKESGKKGQPIEILSYGSGKAVVDAGNSVGISLLNLKFVKVKNITLRGSGRKTGNTDNGLAVSGSKNIEIHNIDVSGFQKSGVFIDSSSHVGITEVYAHDNGFSGIFVSGRKSKADCSHIYIARCRAENNPGDPTVLHNHSGNGILAGFCKNVLIEYCTATNNGWDMPRKGNGPVGIWTYEADSVTIQKCISYRNKTSEGSADGGGFDLDGGVTNSVIQYCLSYENHGSGFGIFQYAGASNWYNNTVRFNISENDGIVSAKAGVYVWNSSRDSTQFTDCHFYNNVIYNDRAAAISYSVESERKGFRFYNNIFVSKDNLIIGDDGTDVFMANDWYSLTDGFNVNGEKNFHNWAIRKRKEQSGEKIIGLNLDPEFDDPGRSILVSGDKLNGYKAYKLPENSVLRKSGINLKNSLGIEPGAVDFNQKAFPVNGIGASF